MIKYITNVADTFLNLWPQTAERAGVEPRISLLALGLMQPRTAGGLAGRLQIFDSTTQLMRDIAAADLPSNNFQKVTAITPLTGDSGTFNANGTDEMIYLTPAGTIANYTIVFPSDANSFLGQVLTILSTQIVSTLTVTSAGLTLNGTAATSLQANVPVRWRKVAASTWSREDATLTSTGVILTSPVITTGMTASGSASNDFSGSTGPMKTSSGLFTVTGAMAAATQALSGAGAANVTTTTTKLTTTGAGNAVTLANGTDGQIKTILHDVDGGSAVLTPATKTGFTTITFTNVGETATLQYATTRGWFILALNGAVAA